MPYVGTFYTKNCGGGMLSGVADNFHLVTIVEESGLYGGKVIMADICVA